MKVSILIPVYNEKKTIMDLLDLVKTVEINKEIIVVDDCSNDGTSEILKKHYGSGKGNVHVIYHRKNKGKGASIRTAIAKASGDYVVVQDGDLEYSPKEIEKLAKYARDNKAEAVYGSRFLNSWRCTTFPHYLVNWFLTTVTNLLFNACLTDMETCYKMVSTEVIKGLGIKAEKFEFEPEVTAKLLKKNIKIYEVPISYRGRSYDEGKKITWRDGVEAVLAILKYRFEGK